MKHAYTVPSFVNEVGRTYLDVYEKAFHTSPPFTIAILPRSKETSQAARDVVASLDLDLSKKIDLDESFNTLRGLKSLSRTVKENFIDEIVLIYDTEEVSAAEKGNTSVLPVGWVEVVTASASFVEYTVWFGKLEYRNPKYLAKMWDCLVALTVALLTNNAYRCPLPKEVRVTMPAPMEVNGDDVVSKMLGQSMQFSYSAQISKLYTDMCRDLKDPIRVQSRFVVSSGAKNGRLDDDTQDYLDRNEPVKQDLIRKYGGPASPRDPNGAVRHALFPPDRDLLVFKEDGKVVGIVFFTTEGTTADIYMVLSPTVNPDEAVSKIVQHLQEESGITTVTARVNPNGAFDFTNNGFVEFQSSYSLKLAPWMNDLLRKKWQ